MIVMKFKLQNLDVQVRKVESGPFVFILQYIDINQKFL